MIKHLSEQEAEAHDVRFVQGYNDAVDDCNLVVASLENAAAKQAERIKALEAALIQLRDCDWTITLPDRMDAVREIAGNALGAGYNGEGE